jgi:glycosyltransferase involved in cell wall biosynthesis
VGTLEPRKNIAGLLRAFARLPKQFPHRLVLVGGPGWNAGSILAALEAPDLKDRVIRPGFVPDADRALFYSAADLFVLPSFYEGFGLPVLEAMTCACPVVASNTSSIPEVAGDAALLCDPRDDDALAQAIAHVLEDDALRSGMVRRGISQAATFSWRSCAETTLAVYRTLAP